MYSIEFVFELNFYNFSKPNGLQGVDYILQQSHHQEGHDSIQF